MDFGIESKTGPWHKGWADVSRKMETGDSVEVPTEREMRSLIQTMRMCGFRSSARRKAGGGYTVKKLGPRPKMIWVKAWKNGVQIRRQIPDPTGETVPIGVTTTFSPDTYKKLQNYCEAAGVNKNTAILEIVEAALLRHERWAAAV